MSKPELPVRAFVEDYCRRAFPNRDFGRGSAANDLVIKAFAGLLQPIRHEIDTVKVNGSLSNWQFMRREDLDLLAANWGRSRQRGSRSTGVVRLYFDRVADYALNNLVFYTADNIEFVLAAPVTITTGDLYKRRLADGNYYFDVSVQSSGVGSRYALPANAIVGVRNQPPGVVRVENPTDFAITSPDESNFDLINSMYKNIGMRNLVSRSSIRAPLLDNFPGITDIYIAGTGHSSMVRDQVTVSTPTGDVLMHSGGMADIWLNTRTPARREITIGYLPSSQRFRIVSEDQANQNELIFAFQRGTLTIDGLFWNPDVSSPQLDESVAFSFDQQDIPVTGFVVGDFGIDRFQLANKDLVSGSEMVALPGRNGYSSVLGDLTGVSFNEADVQVGDMVYYGGKFRRIVSREGRLLDVSPAIENIFNSQYIGAALPAGTRVLPLSLVHNYARVGDRLVVPESPAAGMYQIVGVSTDQLKIARPVSRGQATYVGPESVGSAVKVYQYRSPTGGRPEHPVDVGTAYFLYFKLDGGFDDARYFPITKVILGAGYTEIHILDAGNIAQTYGTDAQLISGLVGSMPHNEIVVIERDDQATFAQGSKLGFDTNHTKYVNSLATDFAAGTNIFKALGVGALADVGDLIVFFNAAVPESDKPGTGGDGSRVSVMIDQLIDGDSVKIRPALNFALTAGMRYAVMRNNSPVASGTVSNVDSINNDCTFTSFPLGLGDGLGLFVKDAAGNFYTVMRSTAGAVKKITFKPPVGVLPVTLSSASYTPPTPLSRGKTVQQVNGGSTYNGVLYDYDNSTRTWYIIPNNPATDLFDQTNVQIQVIGGQGLGKQAAVSGITQRGYVNAVPADLGSLVKQGTYTATLVSYDNATYTWIIKPLSDLDTFDDLESITFADTGGGVPSTGHGQGYLAAAPGVASFSGGTVTLTLDRSIGFAAGDTVQFFSRFGFLGLNFSAENAVVFPDNSVNPSTAFSSVDPGTDELMVLGSDSEDVYSITKTLTHALQLDGAIAPDVVRIANAPDATPLVLSAALPQGVTQLVQTGIGIWAGRGRCVLIEGPGGSQLLPVTSVLGPNEVVLGTPLSRTIYPGQGYTWEVVEALNLPYWVVPDTSIGQYRIFRPPVVYDALQQSAVGGVSSVSPTYFFDNSVSFAELLKTADFSSENVLLFIDSGTFARVEPYVVKYVASDHTIVLDSSANFLTSEVNISYRLVRRNNAAPQEKWYEAIVLDPSGINDTLSLLAPDDAVLDIERYGSYTCWDVVVVPHSGWTNSVWTLPYNWTMPRFRISSFIGSTLKVRLRSKVLGAAENLTVTTTSPYIVTEDMAGGAVNTHALGAFQINNVPDTGDQLVINTSAGPLRFEFRNTGVPAPGYTAVAIGADANETVSHILAAIFAAQGSIEAFRDRTLKVDAVAGHYGALGANDAFDAVTGFKIAAGDKVRVMLRVSDRTQSTQLAGTAVNTYNYYAGNFFDLPIVRISSVELLDASSLQPVKQLEFAVNVKDAGLRYSAKEVNELVISDPDAVFKPLRVVYVTDPTVEQVDAYLNEDDTRVINANQLAKRMETISISAQVSVRTTLTSPEVATILATFINNKRSVSKLTKADLIKELYDNKEIGFIDLSTFRIDGTYYAFDGQVIQHPDVDEVFGSETACYLADNISVTKL